MGRYNHLKQFFINILKLKDSSLVEKSCCRIDHHITPEVSDALEGLNLEFHY